MHGELDRIDSLAARGEIDALLERLAHADWQVRRAALDAVVGYSTALSISDYGPVVDTLVDGLDAEDDAGRRSAAQEALAQLAPRATRRLLERIESASVDVRILLAPVLGDSGSAEAVPALVELARSEDLNVAAAAATGLGRIGRRDAVAPLLSILSNGNAWLVFPAAEALGMLGDDRAVEPLAARLDDMFVRSTALDALVRIGSPRAAKALADRAFAGEVIEAHALSALGRICRAERAPDLAVFVQEAVMKAFAARYDAVRFDELARLATPGSGYADVALEMLGWTGDPRAVEILVMALARSSSRDAAIAGLSALARDSEQSRSMTKRGATLDPQTQLDVAAILAPSSPALAAGLVASAIVADEQLVGESLDVIIVAAQAIENGTEVDPDEASQAVRALVETLVAAPPSVLFGIVRLIIALASAPGVSTHEIDACASVLASSANDERSLAGAELLASRGALDETSYGILRTMVDSDHDLAVHALEVAASGDLEKASDLFERGLASTNARARRAAVGGFATVSTDRSTQALRTAVRDDHAVVASAALVALASRVVDDAGALLFEASHDERPLVRCVAVEHLALLGPSEGTARTVELAINDPESEVRRAALTALARAVESVELSELAIGGMADSRANVRCAAIRLAARATGPRTIDALNTIVEVDASRAARGEALLALADASPVHAIAHLDRAYAKSPSSDYVWRSIVRLAEVAPEQLREFRDGEASPRVGFAIDVVLNESRP